MAENPFDLSNAPITEPASFTAGYWSGWRRELDYDDAVFRLEYRFHNAGHTGVLVGTRSGDYWLFEALGSFTEDFHTDRYRWDLVLVRLSDGEETLHSTGYIQGYATPRDRATHAEIMVAKIESILSGRADSDVESYSIKNRSITKMSVKELVEWRNYYLSEIERTGGSETGVTRPRKNTVRVRFV